MVNPKSLGSVPNIVEHCQLDLISFFLSAGLDLLANKADDLKLHTHNINFEEICDNPSRIYFLCECSK
jgi:hypothetical protein